MKNASLLLIISLLTGAVSFGQLGGISGSKAITLCTQTVSKDVLEFEPTFGINKSSQSWDKDGKLNDTYSTGDSIDLGANLGFRMTYGISKSLEFGVYLPSDASGLSSGMKYNFIKGNKLSVAALAGFTLPINDGPIITNNKRLASTTPMWGMGGVVTYQTNDKLSFDLDFHYQSYIANTLEGNINSLYSSAELGWYFVKGLQLCAGAYYSSANYNESVQNSHTLCIYPGLTVERSKNVIIVLNPFFTIAGANSSKSSGVNVAVTIALN